MLKILHTSDWHLGHSLYNYDRTDEQLAMMDWVVDLVKERQPDLFLLAGDIFHTGTPSNAIQQHFADTVMQLRKAAPAMTVVAISGNHDSGSKHEIFRTPWAALNVYSIGALDCENIDAHIIEVPGKCFVVAVPFVHERNRPDNLFAQLLQRVEQRNTQLLPVVMTAHLTAGAGDFEGHDHSSETTVGGIDSVDLADLGQGYDYLALGHIHKPQFVHGGDGRVRYCGTPLPVSFDECYEHSVSMVEIAAHGEKPVVERVPVPCCWPLVSLPDRRFGSWEEAIALLQHFPPDQQAYIRLNVAVADVLPMGGRDRAMQIVKDKQCRFCHVNARFAERQNGEAAPLTIAQFRDEQSVDIVRRYAADCRKLFDDEMQCLFDEALQMVNADGNLQ